MSEIQDSTAWFALPDDPYFNHPKGNSIRAWAPGDGLMCSSGRRGSLSVPCGVPVAVITTGEGISRSKRIVRNVCAIHAASVIRQLVRDKRSDVALATELQRVAREKVLASHWDEYQDAIAEASGEYQERAFAWLPDDLRNAILANEEDAS